jgi:hypothetical protein
MDIGTKVRYVGNGDKKYEELQNQIGTIIDRLSTKKQDTYIRVRWSRNNYDYGDYLQSRFVKV